ncbi:hypothetical protein B0T09DRAFT_338907 [Sordaria sp. MPI-SDFR-AT-0083]|nr:hypothetical protein B0T09DRAFT_338907 [Sordaria sp. MPI-SDFR-AT-0083]
MAVPEFAYGGRLGTASSLQLLLCWGSGSVTSGAYIGLSQSRCIVIRSLIEVAGFACTGLPAFWTMTLSRCR